MNLVCKNCGSEQFISHFINPVVIIDEENGSLTTVDESINDDNKLTCCCCRRGYELVETNHRYALKEKGRTINEKV